MPDLTLPTLPGELTAAEVDAVGAAIGDSLSPATRRAYAAATRSWEAWCAQRGADPYPGQVHLVAAHLTYLAEQGRSASTLDRTIAALRARHLDLGLDDPTTHRGVQRVRVGLRRRIGTAPRRQAHPLTTEQVRRIVTGIDESTLRGKRDIALVLTGYAAALRPSEVGSLVASDVTVRAKGVVLRLRRSKADQEGAGQYVGVARGQHHETDPVAALLAWIQTAGLARRDPLFPPISWSDLRAGTSPLSAKSVSRIVQGRARAVGLGDLPVSGHSLRAGHATQAAENGVPAERIARTTRHANLRTLQSYVRPSQVLGDTSSSLLGL